MNPIRKKGRGGGGGKALAPHPDELIGVSPTSEETHKSLPGLRTRKPVESSTKSPLEAGGYGSSNLAAAVLRSFQREKEERRSSLSIRAKVAAVVEETIDDSTPKVLEVGGGGGGGGGDKSLPEVPQKKVVRSVSRGKDLGKLPCSSSSKEEKPAPKSEEKRGSRRSVSAQPIRESRHREPFDCSSKIAPGLGLGLQVHRGVAKAFLKSSSSKPNGELRKPEALAKSSSKLPRQEEMGSSEELKEVVELPPGDAPKEPGMNQGLHQRLAKLEEKVSLLASELRDTKELLHASNPVNNQILSEIQSKISNIEKVLVSRSSLSSEEIKACFSENSARSKPSLDEKFLSQLSMLKDKPALHKKLLESRAALQQKIVENRLLLRNKIAALDGSEPGEGEVITAEFLASLKQTQALGGTGLNDLELGSSFASSKFMDSEDHRGSPAAPLPELASEKKRRAPENDDAELRPLRTSGSYKTANSSASEIVLQSLEGLECDEAFEEDEEAKENSAPGGAAYEAPGDESEPELCELGSKAAMAGWFVYEAEGLLLAHEDGSCSFYDSANMEEKSRYKAPHGLAPATWQDCWLIRAAGADGRACKFVVAASAGTAVDPAFCSWNFYEKTVAAYHSEAPPTPNSVRSSRSSGEFRSDLESPLWWYRPCGSLIASAGSGMNQVSLYDIRDAEPVMKWSSSRNLATMGYNSPLHWRSRSSLLVAEDEGITIWDVSNPEAQCISNVSLPGKALQALHIYNSDGECSGGVRQRISAGDTGGIDGVFATQGSVSTLDVRVPSGVGVEIPALGRSFHSIFSQGDVILAGFTGRGGECGVEKWSIRQGQRVELYSIPYSASSHQLQTEVLQVWGDGNHVMGVNGNGLFMFDAGSGTPRAVIGSDDLYCPSFDYSGSKVLLVSRDRPASWQYWPLTHSWSL